MYSVRNKQGYLICRLSNVQVSKVINGFKGHYGKSKFESVEDKNVFILTQSVVIGTDHIHLYLYEGSELIPD